MTLKIPAEIVFLVRRAVRLGRATRGDLAGFFPAPPATLSRLTSQAAEISGIERRGAGRGAYIGPTGKPTPAWASFDHLMTDKVITKKIVTEVSPLPDFYPAEAYHQNYFKLHPEQGYCKSVIDPKVAKFEKLFKENSRLQKEREEKKNSKK